MSMPHPIHADHPTATVGEYGWSGETIIKYGALVAFTVKCCLAVVAAVEIFYEVFHR